MTDKEAAWTNFQLQSYKAETDLCLDHLIKVLTLKLRDEHNESSFISLVEECNTLNEHHYKCDVISRLVNGLLDKHEKLECEFNVIKEKYTSAKEVIQAQVETRHEEDDHIAELEQEVEELKNQIRRQTICVVQNKQLDKEVARNQILEADNAFLTKQQILAQEKYKKLVETVEDLRKELQIETAISAIENDGMNEQRRLLTNFIRNYKKSRTEDRAKESFIQLQINRNKDLWHKYTEYYKNRPSPNLSKWQTQFEENNQFLLEQLDLLQNKDTSHISQSALASSTPEKQSINESYDQNNFSSSTPEEHSTSKSCDHNNQQEQNLNSDVNASSKYEHDESSVVAGTSSEPISVSDDTGSSSSQSQSLTPTKVNPSPPLSGGEHIENNERKEAQRPTAATPPKPIQKPTRINTMSRQAEQLDMSGANEQEDMCARVIKRVPHYNSDIDHKNPALLQRYLVLARSAVGGLTAEKEKEFVSYMIRVTLSGAIYNWCTGRIYEKFDDFENDVCSRFGEIVTLEEVWDKIQNIRQGKDETILDLGNRMERLIRKYQAACAKRYPDHQQMPVAGLTVTAFVKALNDEQVALHLVGKMPETLDDAISTAVKFFEQRRRFAKESEPIRCQLCGQVGHIAPNCTQKSNQQRFGRKSETNYQSYYGEQSNNRSNMVYRNDGHGNDGGSHHRQNEGGYGFHGQRDQRQQQRPAHFGNYNGQRPQQRPAHVDNYNYNGPRQPQRPQHFDNYNGQRNQQQHPSRQPPHMSNYNNSQDDGRADYQNVPPHYRNEPMRDQPRTDQQQNHSTQPRDGQRLNHHQMSAYLQCGLCGEIGHAGFECDQYDLPRKTPVGASNQANQGNSNGQTLNAPASALAN